jgi:GNAT superfamily N-acetyltransferase
LLGTTDTIPQPCPYPFSKAEKLPSNSFVHFIAKSTFPATKSPMAYSIHPITFADARPLAKKAKEDGFMTDDRHTQLKMLGKGNINYLQDDTLEVREYREIQRLKKPREMGIKAVDNETGEIVGTSHFIFHGFELDDIPKRDLGEEPIMEKPQDIEAEQIKIEDFTEADHAIARMEDMEEKDMQHWQSILMPPGSKCIVVAGHGVDEKHRRRGLSGAMLKWATDHADNHGVHMWVHSSEMGWLAYAKAGFEVVGILDIDMDAWAPGPAPEGEGALWGHYVVRYMKRLPKKSLDGDN